MTGRLRRRASLGLAAAVLAVVRPALRDDEVKEAFEEFVGVIEEHLEVFLDRYERERCRAGPAGGRRDEGGR